MCGFAGIVSWDEHYPVTPDTLDAMSQAVAHRGPDGEGVYLNNAGPASREKPQCGLVHRRLAILDPDRRSLQPFDDGSNNRLLVFNGEIYNFHDIRIELSRLLPRYAWRTTGDTEVLLLALQTWGMQACEKLNGMFAFAYWDQRAGSLMLGRDRMGQKPLYYASPGSGGAIAFASELHVFRKVPWFDASIDFPSVCDYLKWGYIPSPRTIYLHARKLPPANVAKTSGGGVSFFKYYDPNAHTPSTPGAGESSGKAVDANIQKTRRLVSQAVQRQLVSDVPVGCFLSGGIDSSIVAAAMSAGLPKGQRALTFSIGFDDPRYDETRYASAVAKHLETQHREFRVTPQASEDLPKLAHVYGEPFGDSSALPTHYLARAAREHVKVALSGDGGDELFGGYDRYRAMQLGQTFEQLPWIIRSVVMSGAWQHLPGTHPKSQLTRIKRLLASVRLPAPERYASHLRLFRDDQIEKLLNLENQSWVRPTDDWTAATFAQLLEDRDVVSAAAATDRVTYLPEDLLTKVDRASMLHALEVRSPFMDHDLVDFSATLDASQLIAGGGKRLLREAFRADLPAEVFTRRKMGFALPIGEWLAGELRSMLEGLLFGNASFAAAHFVRDTIRSMIDAHVTRRADHSQRLYALLMLELWWQEFGR